MSLRDDAPERRAGAFVFVRSERVFEADGDSEQVIADLSSRRIVYHDKSSGHPVVGRVMLRGESMGDGDQPLDAIPAAPFVRTMERGIRFGAWLGSLLTAESPFTFARVPRSDPPGLALRLLGRDEAAHYAREWGAHLWELVSDGEHRQARRDRRRMALGAPWLALQLRTRALLRRRLRSPR